MVDDPAPIGPPERHEEETVVVERRPLWQRIAKWIAITVVGLIVLLALALLALNTSPGRRFLADRIAGYVGAYYVALGGRVDALVFAGGIGEKSPRLRARVAAQVACLGFAEVDEARNNGREAEDDDDAVPDSPRTILHR